MANIWVSGYVYAFIYYILIRTPLCTYLVEINLSVCISDITVNSLLSPIWRILSHRLPGYGYAVTLNQISSRIESHSRPRCKLKSMSISTLLDLILPLRYFTLSQKIGVVGKEYAVTFHQVSRSKVKATAISFCFSLIFFHIIY